MNKVLRWVIVIGIILVTFVLPVSLYVVSDTNSDTTAPSIEPVVEDSENVYLRFLSIPPKVGIPEGRFMYQVVVDDIKGDGIDIMIESMPSWMEWDADSFTLSGDIPAEQSPFFVSIKATSVSGDVEIQSFTVDVDPQDERDVKGAQTIRAKTGDDWVDPFHPTNTTDQIMSDSLALTGDDSNVSVLGAKDMLISEPKDESNSSKYIAVAVASIAAFVVITTVYLHFTSDKQKFIKGTGKLIIERGKG